MQFGLKNPSADLAALGLKNYRKAYWNASPEELIEATIRRDMGQLSDTGAINVRTGEFTGRSPKDRFIVKDELTANEVDWNDINLPFEPAAFDKLYNKIVDYFAGRDVFVRDAFCGVDERYRIGVRVVNEYPWSNMFVYNMFLRPSDEEVQSFEPDWTVINAPGFRAIPEVDGTRQHNFAIINFKRKCIIIGGTAYTGEIKKGIFSVMNFLLPVEHHVLPMHCSANVGKDEDTAIFFGLSGTGKTTLSADPNRELIGDDEHGWTDDGVFNFEGGCYAKTIDLTEEKEPDIYRAIKHGAILENVIFHKNTRRPDYTDASITQNTRVSYPIHHIDNARIPSRAGQPTNIFFLTCDAFGVLPPIARLTPAQAAYFFISGYTAKVAGTELGIDEPMPIFSACFGAPFLPLHPARYAAMLAEKMKAQNTKVWLVNTGWSDGPAGETKRIKLAYTRAMITAALSGQLDNVEYHTHTVFGFDHPIECPGVPSRVMSPKAAWNNDERFYTQANKLANAFINNFKKFEAGTEAEVLAAAPKPRNMSEVLG
ncbi:MAG: phosphoenolpyruvate carboxykinase (ATP) [Bacteroidetes bacterium]|nr:MAG: phosphoenolpyruvate carboxykinase (ATP) [Bacteroidota bacterium]